MASQKKTVQFDLFKAYYLKKNKDGSQQECLYDLTGLLQHIANHPFSDTKKKIFGDTQMFHVCRENAKSPAAAERSSCAIRSICSRWAPRTLSS